MKLLVVAFLLVLMCACPAVFANESEPPDITGTITCVTGVQPAEIPIPDGYEISMFTMFRGDKDELEFFVCFKASFTMVARESSVITISENAVSVRRLNAHKEPGSSPF